MPAALGFVDMGMRLLSTLLLWAAVLLVSVPAAQAAKDKPGKRLYERNCAFCHGSDGRGGGADAGFLTEPPPSLAQARRATIDELTKRILDGRPLDLQRGPRALASQRSATEALVVHLQKLPQIDWEQLEPTWQLYLDRCSECHGAYGNPPAELDRRVRRPRRLSDLSLQQYLTDADILEAIRHGKRGMPKLAPAVSDAEAHSLLAFVRLLSPGFETYSQYCANCHGIDGRGAEAIVSGEDAPEVVFDRDFFEKTDVESLRLSAWHMLRNARATMPHYRRVLSESEARAIATYVQQLGGKRR